MLGEIWGHGGHEAKVSTWHGWVEGGGGGFGCMGTWNFVHQGY